MFAERLGSAPWTEFYDFLCYFCARPDRFSAAVNLLQEGRRLGILTAPERTAWTGLGWAGTLSERADVKTAIDPNALASREREMAFDNRSHGPPHIIGGPPATNGP